MTDVRAGRPRSKVTPKLIVALILLALALIFIFQNTGAGDVKVLFWTVSLPAWIWLLVVLLIGVVIGSMFPWFRPKKKYIKG